MPPRRATRFCWEIARREDGCGRARASPEPASDGWAGRAAQPSLAGEGDVRARLVHGALYKAEQTCRSLDSLRSLRMTRAAPLPRNQYSNADGILTRYF